MDDLASVYFLKMQACKWTPKDMDPHKLMQFAREMADFHRSGKYPLWMDQTWKLPEKGAE